MLTLKGFIVESNVISVLIERSTKIMLCLFGQPNDAYAWSQILGSSVSETKMTMVFWGGIDRFLRLPKEQRRFPRFFQTAQGGIHFDQCIFEHSFFDIVIHRKINQAGHNHTKSHARTFKSPKNSDTTNNPLQQASGNFFPLCCLHDSLWKSTGGNPNSFPSLDGGL